MEGTISPGKGIADDPHAFQLSTNDGSSSSKTHLRGPIGPNLSAHGDPGRREPDLHPMFSFQSKAARVVATRPSTIDTTPMIATQ